MILGEDVKMSESACTSCGKKVDMASCVGEEDAKPKPGDLTVCFGCGHIMAFDENMLLREMTNEEATEIAGDRRILAIQWARGRVKTNAG